MKRLEDNSDVPEARHGTLSKKHIHAPTERQRLHSARPRRNGYSRLRQQKSRRKDSLWLIPVASMNMVSEKDLYSAEMETIRTSRSPTTVMTANGEVRTREETENVKELDLFVTVMLLEETPAVLHRRTSTRIMGTLTTGPAVKNHISPKMARELIANFQTIYHSWFLLYQRLLQLRLHLPRHHLHHRSQHLMKELPKGVGET